MHIVPSRGLGREASGNPRSMALPSGNTLSATLTTEILSNRTRENAGIALPHKIVLLTKININRVNLASEKATIQT
jgi:hypothetical protein